MRDQSQILYYIHDPMCSWCWGFRPVFEQLKQALPDSIEVCYVLGGLAPDTDLPMPQSMQGTIRETWRTIQQEIPGTEFNYDFWTSCRPRRSTYPACRAIIASRMQQPESAKEMLYLIQQAYYLQAKNPSDIDVLLELAEQLDLDVQKFSDDMGSEVCQNELLKEIEFCRNLKVSSYPSLVLKLGETYTPVDIDYNDSKKMLDQILLFRRTAI